MGKNVTVSGESLVYFNCAANYFVHRCWRETWMATGTESSSRSALYQKSISKHTHGWYKFGEKDISCNKFCVTKCPLLQICTHCGYQFGKKDISSNKFCFTKHPFLQTCTHHGDVSKRLFRNALLLLLYCSARPFVAVALQNLHTF